MVVHGELHFFMALDNDILTIHLASWTELLKGMEGGTEIPWWVELPPVV